MSSLIARARLIPIAIHSADQLCSRSRALAEIS
jgi:hypothetical protein